MSRCRLILSFIVFLSLFFARVDLAKADLVAFGTLSSTIDTSQGFPASSSSTIVWADQAFSVFGGPTVNLGVSVGTTNAATSVAPLGGFPPNATLNYAGTSPSGALDLAATNGGFVCFSETPDFCGLTFGASIAVPIELNEPAARSSRGKAGRVASLCLEYAVSFEDEFSS